MNKQVKALQLRAKALALLEEAAALDGLKPYSVTHRHHDGASTYLLWAAEAPGKGESAKVLDDEFEPDKGEELDIETAFTLEELSRRPAPGYAVSFSAATQGIAEAMTDRTLR